MSIFLPIVASLLAAYGGLVLFALLRAQPMIFPAPPASYTEREIGAFALPDGAGGNLPAVWLPHAGARHVLLYCHGNAEDLGSIYSLLEEYRRFGLSVFAFEYPGYGTAEGPPSEAKTLQAAEAAYDYLTDELGVDPARIVLYGRSLGGGPAFHLAATREVGALIVDGTFLSTFRVMTRWKLLPWDVFDNVALAPEVEAPVLLIHGTEDTVVPFWHARALHESLDSPKSYFWVEGAGHNDLLAVAGPAYWEVLERFLRSL